MSTMLALRRRELGAFGDALSSTYGSPRTSLGYGLAEVRRMGLVRGRGGGLLPHAGCVNCVSWGNEGALLLTGSDDRRIKVWDTRNVHDPHLAVNLFTGHYSNIFDAQFVPGSDCRQVVSCARRGTLLMNDIEQSAEIDLLDMYDTIYGFIFWEDHASGGQVLFTAQEDGEVFQIDLRAGHRIDSILQRKTPIEGPLGVRTLALPPQGSPHSSNLLTLGGEGPQIEVHDLRVLRTSGRRGSLKSPSRPALHRPCVKPVSTLCPNMLSNKSISRGLSVSSLTYGNYSSELLANYQNSMAFAFEDPLSRTSRDGYGLKAFYGGHVNNLTVLKRAVYFGPRDEYVCCGSDTGHIWIYDRVTGKVVELLVGDDDIVNGIEPHPHLPVFATYGLDDHAKIWTVGGSQRRYASELDCLEEVLDKTLDAARELLVYPEREIRRAVSHLRSGSSSRNFDEDSSDGSQTDDPPECEMDARISMTLYQ